MEHIAQLPTYPALPVKMQRSQVIDLLTEIASDLGIRGDCLRFLLFTISSTRPSDWTSGQHEPVCFSPQVEIATALGKTERMIWNYERRLSRDLGLIEKRVAANGSRSRAGTCGLVFSTLIKRIPDLLALRNQRRAERQYIKALVRRRSIYARHIKAQLIELHPAAPEDATLAVVRDEWLSWPASRDLRRMDLDALSDHVAAASRLCDCLDDWSLDSDDSSGRDEINFRSHIQATTQEESVSCNDKSYKRTEGLPSDTNFPTASPDGDADCIEKKNAASADARKSEFLESFSSDRLYRVCTEEMQFRVDIERGDRMVLRPRDFVIAACERLSQLGINHSAWSEAVDQMGQFTAALCVVVADANQDHPVTPVRNPGGLLRAMTRRHREGRLNLTGSLIGLTERCGSGP